MPDRPALGRAGLGVALLVGAVALGGCSLLRPKGADDSAGASAAKVDEARAQYRIDVQAPGALKGLLERNLDIARFRDAPSGQALSTEELDRLVAVAPEQIREILATEGYFTPTVQVERRAGTPLPVLAVQVAPGPRTQVGSVNIGIEGDLRRRADAGDRNAGGLVARVRDGWPLGPGQPFAQGAWTNAKSATLDTLHAGGYPAATWQRTDARITSREQRADLDAVADSGPLFVIGTLRVEGLQRYDERVVRNLATVQPGEPYSQRKLIDYQDRLVRSGLFEGGSVEIDPDPAVAAATPVTVRVREQPLQQLKLGLGVSTDTGVRATAEHTHRQIFGLRASALNKVELGNQRKAWEWDVRSYPQRGFQRNLFAGQIENLRSTDERRNAVQLRAGRAWEDPRLERQAYLQYDNARVRKPLTGQTRAQSLTANVSWNRRAVDSLLLPNTGTALLVQAAAGYAQSSSAENGPLARLYGRLYWFKPLPRAWQTTLRLEAGQVFARQSVGVPDTLLFRAGGDDSVRGYDYRTLGPRVNGEVTSGRSLLTASAEVAHPLTAKLPALLGAVFVDAGNAAQRFGDISPVVGTGVGVRYRSPIGPIRADVAYGVDDKQLRLHLSAGVSF